MVGNLYEIEENYSGYTSTFWFCYNKLEDYQRKSRTSRVFFFFFCLSNLFDSSSANCELGR